MDKINMVELSDEEVFGKSRELSDAEVFGQPQEQTRIPQAFIDRIRRGYELEQATREKIDQLGSPFEAAAQRTRESVISGQRQEERSKQFEESPLHVLTRDPLATAWAIPHALFIRPLQTGAEMTGRAAHGENIEFEPDLLLKGAEAGSLGMLRTTQFSRVFSRVRPTSEGLQHQPIGPLPTAQDFTNAATVLAPEGGFTAFHGSPSEFQKFRGKSVDVATEPSFAESYRQPRGAPAQFGKARSSGFLYQVEVGAKQEDFLNLDRPLTGQSEQVKAALGKAGIAVDDRLGMDAWDALRDASSADEAAKTLQDAGIPGTSREHGVFSVFDPSILQITHKNGVS